MSVQWTGLYAIQDLTLAENVAYGLARSRSGVTARTRGHDNRTYVMDIKPRLPTFSGESDTWEPFFMQLQHMSRSYGWSDTKFRDQLMFALRGEAFNLLFAFHLPHHIWENKMLLKYSAQRFRLCLLTDVCPVQMPDNRL